VNVIRIGEREFLLAVTGGEAVHLAPEAGPGQTARSAVPHWHLPPKRANSDVRWRDYDRAALADARWAGAALCGRQWISMARGEDGDTGEPGRRAFSPTCRGCLAIMDRLFPDPVLDDRFSLIVQVITDTIAEHGYAEMRNVPGDQQAALRKQVRSALKQQTGHGIQTLVHESMVVFICEPIHQQFAAERARATAQAMNKLLTEESTTPIPTPWCLSWDTWAAG
jgi:hypothetical protein